MTLTREKLTELVLRQDHVAVHAIGRALVHLLNRQTEEEARANTTRVHNARGFTPGDAYSGALTAKYYLKHRKLQDWQIVLWQKPNAKGVPRIAKYWKQLAEEAKKKAESK